MSRLWKISSKRGNGFCLPGQIQEMDQSAKEKVILDITPLWDAIEEMKEVPA